MKNQNLNRKMNYKSFFSTNKAINTIIMNKKRTKFKLIAKNFTIKQR